MRRQTLRTLGEETCETLFVSATRGAVTTAFTAKPTEPSKPAAEPAEPATSRLETG
jgi:hypothetical protein